MTILIQKEAKKRADEAQATRNAAEQRAKKSRQSRWCVNPDILSMAERGSNSRFDPRLLRCCMRATFDW